MYAECVYFVFYCGGEGSQALFSYLYIDRCLPPERKQIQWGLPAFACKHAQKANGHNTNGHKGNIITAALSYWNHTAIRARVWFSNTRWTRDFSSELMIRCIRVIWMLGVSFLLHLHKLSSTWPASIRFQASDLLLGPPLGHLLDVIQTLQDAASYELKEIKPVGSIAMACTLNAHMQRPEPGIIARRYIKIEVFEIVDLRSMK